MLRVRAGGKLALAIGSLRYFTCFEKCNIKPLNKWSVRMTLRPNKLCKNDNHSLMRRVLHVRQSGLGQQEDD
jgi:hypothetical protein